MDLALDFYYYHSGGASLSARVFYVLVIIARVVESARDIIRVHSLDYIKP